VINKKLDTFELTEDHIKLVTNMYVSWGDAETGAPAINPKRPYGNSDVPGDVYRVLHDDVYYGDTHQDEYGDELDMPEGMEEDYEKLHRQTETALQIVLCTKSFTPGIYVKTEQYDDLSWGLASSLPNE
jgi:hypothetical protein